MYDEITASPARLSALKAALERLLEFLSGSGRTDANCWAVDLFFGVADHEATCWDHLPTEYADVLADMGGALHDTCTNPDVAGNFESLPEQLLARVKALHP